MNAPQSATKTIESASWIASREPIPVGQPRLVVVISAVSDEPALARRILALSMDPSLPLLLVGAAATWDAEYELRRSLVAVESFLAAQGRRVELWTDSGHGWLARLAGKCARTDKIACYEELGTAAPRQPLSDLLAEALRLPVRDLTDLVSRPQSRVRLIPQAAAWLGSIALIAGFWFLQARIVTEMMGWAQNVMLLLTVGAEVSLIWIWNALLG